MRKIFKTNRDIVAYSLVALWLVTNIICFILGGIIAANISSYSYMLIFVILIIIDRTNNKFHNWLNKKINYDS